MRLVLSIIFSLVFFFVDLLSKASVTFSTNRPYIYDYFVFYYVIAFVMQNYIILLLFTSLICAAAYFYGETVNFGNEIIGRETFPKLGIIFAIVMATFLLYLYFTTFQIYCASEKNQRFFPGIEMSCGTRKIYPRGLDIGWLISELFSGVLYFIHLITDLTVAPYFGWVFGRTLPSFVAGIVAASTQHPAKKVVERSLARSGPDRTVERELERIMNSQDASDAELERALRTLYPWERWVKRIQYRTRARDARQLREMAELRRQALHEEGGLAQAVHEMERSRRHTHDRGTQR